MGEDDVVHGATGSGGGVEGVIISGYEDRYIRFFDANSGMYPGSSHTSPVMVLVILMFRFRPMYIYNARSPLGDLIPLTFTGWPRISISWPRRESQVLEP